MEKQPIKVENTTMFAVTVPVKIILDLILPDSPLFTLEHFRLIETDGYYIVSVERFKTHGPSDLIYQCFIQEDDAWSYLEMHGIEKKEYIDVEEETDFGREYD